VTLEIDVLTLFPEMFEGPLGSSIPARIRERGLADVRIHGDRLHATLLGDVAPFVRAVASPSLLDLTIEPARLEEAFLEYYAGDEPDSDGTKGTLTGQPE